LARAGAERDLTKRKKGGGGNFSKKRLNPKNQREMTRKHKARTKMITNICPGIRRNEAYREILEEIQGRTKVQIDGQNEAPITVKGSQEGVVD